MLESSTSENPSPQDLNVAFKGLYDLIPNHSWSEATEIHDLPPPGLPGDPSEKRRMLEEAVETAKAIQNRRKDSEFTAKKLELLKGLLAQSQITPTFQLRILSEYNFVSISGMTRPVGQPEHSRLTDMLELDVPESGGIFETESAKRIERRKFTLSKQEATNLIADNPDLPQELIDNLKNEEEVWKLEFFQLHGENLEDVTVAHQEAD